MKSQVLTKLKSPLELEERPALRARQGHVVVHVKSAALNRRDYWITQGLYPGIQLPIVLGSDGCGEIESLDSLGDGVDAAWAGAAVIINPGWKWGERQEAQCNDFRILGMPDDGTFSEQVIVPVEYIHRKPEFLDWHQSAALPLAGLTAYRAVFTRGELRQGETVLITGIGGGVAGFALQFATAIGAKAIVTSSSAAKISRACELGAAAGYDYRKDDWYRSLEADFGPVDLIVDSAAGPSYGDLIKVASFGGRIVNYGATAGKPEKLDIFSIFWKQLSLLGTTMGSPSDFAAMLDFVEKHQITPIIDDVIPFQEANSALQRMANAEQFGKIVLDIHE